MKRLLLAVLLALPARPEIIITPGQTTFGPPITRDLYQVVMLNTIDGRLSLTTVYAFNIPDAMANAPRTFPWMAVGAWRLDQ